MYQVWQYLILWMLKVKAGMGIWKIIIWSEIEQDKEEWLAYPPPLQKISFPWGL